MVRDIPTPRGSGVVFVTGAGGFLGGAVAAAFQDGGWRVAGFDREPWRADPGLGQRAADLFIEGDVDSARLSQASKALGPPELVFHAAGGASVGASLADPEADRARTVGSLLQTLAFLEREAPAARLVYPSSAAVYGEAASGPIPETAPLAPVSPYGRHKAEAEALIRQSRLDAVIIRFFSVYGPGLRKQLFWELAGRLASNPPELELAGGGEEARDFLFVDDAVGLVAAAARLDRRASPLVLNGATGRAVTVREAAEALGSSLGRDTRFRFNGRVRQGDPKSLVADVSLSRALGFEAEVDLQHGMQRLARWFMGQALGLREPASY